MAAGSDYAIATTEANTTKLGNYDFPLPYANPTGTITFAAQQANSLPATHHHYKQQ